jgi:D-alanyl-lipoteichoic acid acyltransferase DltB (MBOAT superfamily)
MPLGFSFYILQVISYLIDIYKSKINCESNFIDFSLYLLYFPKFLAGPIERSGNFLPQLKTGRVVDNQQLIQGFSLIFTGLIRKVIIAQILLSILPQDYIHSTVINTHPELGVFSFPFFTYTESIPYANRVMGIVAFGIFLYNDFAGYTGIVRGISLLMGISLSDNFRTPFFATSLSGFWSRWHISLSSWLRDYLYFPFTRYLKKKVNRQGSFIPIIVPLLTTMLLSGFWHGLTIPLMTWGLIYGLVMTIEQIAFQKWSFLRPQFQPQVVKVLLACLTFIIVTLAWVPFTANSYQEILAFWKVIFKGSAWNSPASFSYFIPILIAASFFLDFLQNEQKDELFFLRWSLPIRATFVAFSFIFLFLAFSWTAQYDSKVFIYQGF